MEWDLEPENRCRYVLSRSVVVGGRTMISAVILAAGLSTRMGRLKLLLPYGGHTVVEQIASVLLASPVDEVLAVTGYQRTAVEATLAKWPVQTVFNPHYAHGEMLSSVQAGLRAVSADSRAALLVVGDMPAIEEDVVTQLVQAYRTAGDNFVYIPSYQMRAGHPVLVPRLYWPPILALPAGDSLRSVLQAESTRVRWVVVDTPSVLRDMDAPADYERELGLRTQESGT
jgi:molybdenum cofactor cytidylyltransferase